MTHDGGTALGYGGDSRRTALAHRRRTRAGARPYRARGHCRVGGGVPGHGLQPVPRDRRAPSYVNVFLERENVRSLRGLDTPVHDGAVIYIIKSVAGGSIGPGL